MKSFKELYDMEEAVKIEPKGFDDSQMMVYYLSLAASGKYLGR